MKSFSLQLAKIMSDKGYLLELSASYVDIKHKVGNNITV
jgi:hypothetical protein